MESQVSDRQLRGLHAYGEQARVEVLARARQRLAKGQDPHAVLDYLAHTLTNRVLHAPTAALRMAALEGDVDVARAAEKLFPAADILDGESENGGAEKRT
jgi:glutamyl-tRNA reductase